MAHQHNWKYDPHSKTVICLFPLCGGVITVHDVVAATTVLDEGATFDEIYEYTKGEQAVPCGYPQGEINDTKRNIRGEQSTEAGRAETVFTDDSRGRQEASDRTASSGKEVAGGSEPAEAESTKYCTMCRIIKGSSEFHKRRASADGKQPVCKDCNASRVRASRAKSRGRALTNETVSQFRDNVGPYNSESGRVESCDSESTQGVD